MLFAALFTCLFALVIAAKQNGRCSKQLAGIVYSPDGPYKSYLQGISSELKFIADLYNTQYGQNLLTSFANKYGLVVVVVDAFGNINEYVGDYVISVPTFARNDIYSSRDARSVLNLGAYANEQLVNAYSFLSFGSDGQVYEVTIGRPTVDDLP